MGWVASSVRDILHNKSYIGAFSYKKKQWKTSARSAAVRSPLAMKETALMPSEIASAMWSPAIPLRRPQP